MSRRLLLIPLFALSLLLQGLVAVGSVAMVAPERLWPRWPEARDALDAAVAQAPAELPTADPELRLATLSLVAQEDRRLFQRRLPVDLRSCLRAAAADLRAGAVREGCSTLPMQLARLSMPPELFSARTVSRKLLQIRLALRLVGTSPERVVAAYLKALPCGSDLARGVEACSLLRFGRPAADLNAAEAVALFTAVPAPSRELASPERAAARVRRSLGLAVALGWVPVDQAVAAVRAPLVLGVLHPELVRAARAGQDLALTGTLRTAVAAARARAVEKQGSDDDLLVLGAVFDADGRVLATAGAHPSWLDRPFEAGSWVKPFCAAALLEAPGPGARYLEQDTVPLHLPLYDRNLHRYRPRNASSHLPARAVPADWILRSVNTATLASVLFAPVTLSGPDRARYLQAHLRPEERVRYDTPTDRRLTRELASAYAGFPVTAEEVADLPGYRALTLAGTRACLGRMAQHVGPLEVPREDLAALLGVVRAPLGALAGGLADLWLDDGQLTPVARLMARHSGLGTLGWLTRALDRLLVYKTATAERNAMLAVVLDGPTGPRLLVLAAVRPSGAPITPIQGGTLGAGVLAFARDRPGS